MLGLTSPLLSLVPGVSHRFFGRVGGTSPHPYNALNTSFDVSDAPARVHENLARVRFQIGVPARALYACTQVHGREVLVVTAADDAEAVRTHNADALVTLAHDVAVAVRTADCAPILLAVNDGSGVAAVHAGWRGAVGGVLESAVRELCARAGTQPSQLVAAIGPTIGIDAFEVGPEVMAQAAAVVDISGLSRPGHLDLRGMLERLLAQAGVVRIDVVGGCTVANEAGYFSHRRDVTWRKCAHTGRQMSAIARTKPPVLGADR